MLSFVCLVPVGERETALPAAATATRLLLSYGKVASGPKACDPHYSPTVLVPGHLKQSTDHGYTCEMTSFVLREENHWQ